MSPIDTRILAKRDGLAIPLPSIIGILVAIIVINTMLLIGLCIVRNRRRVTREIEERNESPISPSSYTSFSKPGSGFFGPMDVEKSRMNYAASRTRSFRKAPPDFLVDERATPETFAITLPNEPRLPPPTATNPLQSFLQPYQHTLTVSNESTHLRQTSASDMTDASFYPSELVNRPRTSAPPMRRTRSMESISIYSQTTNAPGDYSPNTRDSFGPPLPPKRVSQGYQPYHPQPLDTITEGSSQSSHRDRLLSEISWDTPVRLAGSSVKSSKASRSSFDPAFSLVQPIRAPPKAAKPPQSQQPEFFVPSYVEPLHVRKHSNDQRRRSLDDGKVRPFKLNVNVGEVVPAPLSAPMIPRRNPLRA